MRERKGGEENWQKQKQSEYKKKKSGLTSLLFKKENRQISPSFDTETVGVI